jgi:hypothetical protein
MNAYELADILHQSDFLAMDFAEDAATMLRQQADRIAELEKLVSEMKYEKSSGVYTHPVKQLSDEEIKEICEKTGVFFDGVDTYRFARAIIKEITE